MPSPPPAPDPGVDFPVFTGEAADADPQRARFNELLGKVRKLEAELAEGRRRFEAGLRTQADRVRPRLDAYAGDLEALLGDLAALIQGGKLGKARKAKALELAHEMLGTLEVFCGRDTDHWWEVFVPDPDPAELDFMEEMERHMEAAEKRAAKAERKRAEREARGGPEPAPRGRRGRHRKPDPLEEARREAERRVEEERRRNLRDLRALYLRLAREFHPDKEPDPAERERKAEWMKSITAAYEANDLFGLLRVLAGSGGAAGARDYLGGLGQDVIGSYVQLLQARKRELEGERSRQRGDQAFRRLVALGTPGEEGEGALAAIVMQIESESQRARSLRTLLGNRDGLRCLFGHYPEVDPVTPRRGRGRSR